MSPAVWFAPPLYNKAVTGLASETHRYLITV